MPFNGRSFYEEAETPQIAAICRKLMKQNEVTYHLYGFGQYNRGTTNLEAAVNQLNWWATYCKSRGVESDECNDIEKAFEGMKAGETKPFYSKGGNHIASLVRNY